MKIGNVTLTVDGDILSMDDDRGVGTRMNREAAAELWPAIKRFAKMGWIKAPAEPIDPPAKRGNKHRIRELEARVIALEEAAKREDVQMPSEEAVEAAIAASLPEHKSEFTFPEHEMAPKTAWVLANEHGVIFTRFCGLQPKPKDVYEIAFFESEENAEMAHDALGLRGRVRPQLVNRNTLEPVE